MVKIPYIQSKNNQGASLNTISQNQDSFDTSLELKTEFYTREGLWKIVPNGEYIRQPQSMYTQQQNMANNNAENNMNNNCNNNNMQLTSNEPCKIICFKYFRFDEVSNMEFVYA